MAAKTPEEKAAEKAAKATISPADAHIAQTAAHEAAATQAVADAVKAKADADAKAKADELAAGAKLVEASRKERWAGVLERVEKQNPLAFAARKATGEFDTIPASFE